MTASQIVGDAIVDALAVAGVAADATTTRSAVRWSGAMPGRARRRAGHRQAEFAIRKEAKDHGVGGRIAGVLEAGQRVLVVEDTATSGGSLLEALPAVAELGCPIVAVSLLLDRGGELGAELAATGIPYCPVLGAPDLGYEFGS